ncbi:MAG: hypothetical protein WHV26_12470 [Spirochaetota bacterium]
MRTIVSIHKKRRTAMYLFIFIAGARGCMRTLRIPHAGTIALK